MTDSPTTDQIAAVKTMIDVLPIASQRRIAVTAQILRDLLARDNEHGESMLAFTLVMAEVSSD